MSHLSATVPDNRCMLGNVSQVPLNFCRAHISPGTARCKCRISLSAQKWWPVNGTARCKCRISLSAQKWWPVNGTARCKCRISLSAQKWWPVNGTARCKCRISLSAQKWWPVNGTARCKCRISLSAQKWWPVNGPTTWTGSVTIGSFFVAVSSCPCFITAVFGQWKLTTPFSKGFLPIVCWISEGFVMLVSSFGWEGGLMTFSTMYVSSNRCSLMKQFMLCIKLAYTFGRYSTLQFMFCMKLVYTFGRYSTLQFMFCMKLPYTFSTLQFMLWMKLMYTFGRYSTLLLFAGSWLEKA